MIDIRASGAQNSRHQRRLNMVIDPYNQSQLFSMMGLQQSRLEKSHQLVVMKNFDEKQTHYVFDRHYRQIELKAGQQKEIDIIADEIPGWLQRARTRPQDQGFYETGVNMGKALPSHPVRIISGLSESYLQEFNRTITVHT
jgi:hypothetical protein